MARRLLLLGGGLVHAQVLRALAQQPLVGAEVALLAPHAQLLHPALLPGIVTGQLRPDEATVALPALAEAARARFVEGSVAALHANKRCALLADGRVAEYELLSIDTGPVIDRDAIPGAREHALFPWPAEPGLRLLEALWDLAARRVLDVVVLGADADAVALALALQHRLAGQGEERARIALVTGGGEPLAGDALLQPFVRKALERARITVFREACSRIGQGVLHLASGARLACDAPLVAGPLGGPGWLGSSGLQVDAQGHVAVGATLQSLSHPEVFAAPSQAASALLLNLRRLSGGGLLQPARLKRGGPRFLPGGDGRAWLAWGRLVAQGRWCGGWMQRRALAERSRSA
jgi:NADH dehydrogenase FAD-containing subunit